MKFSDTLRKERNLQNLTQAELADIAGLDVTAINHFETGRRRPSLKNFRLLVESLNVSADKLLGFHVKKSPKFEELYGRLSAVDQKLLLSVMRRFLEV
jgi:transcriptional regulator with XRE-family HTH domain